MNIAREAVGAVTEMLRPGEVMVGGTVPTAAEVSEVTEALALSAGAEDSAAGALVAAAEV